MPTFELEESDYAGPMDDDSIFGAEVISVKLAEKPYHEDKDDPTSPKVKKIEFKFVIQHPDSPFDGTNVWGETGTRFNSHPDCKLKNWAQEIMATEFPIGYSLNTDVLIGGHCRVIVGRREYQKNGEDKVANFVKDVLRSRDAMGDEEPF